MSKIFLSCAFVLFFSSQFLLATETLTSNPVGEIADYQLDKDSNRTSSSIKQGTVDLKVLRYKPEYEEKGVYEVELVYDLLVTIVGPQQGKENIDVPEKYFTQEFWNDLRKNGSYTSDEFKIKHEGYGDTRTIDGTVYKKCDKLYFYDIKTNSNSTSIELIRNLFIWTVQGYGIEVSPRADIEDLEIRGFFKDGVPVLRGVKLDISGYIDGVFAKAGFDFIKKN